MKLDPNQLRYLAREDFRVLTAVELGMRNVRARLAARASPAPAPAPAPPPATAPSTPASSGRRPPS